MASEGDDLHHRKENGVVPHRTNVRLAVLVVDGPGILYSRSSAGECLYHLHAGDAFLQKGIQQSHLGAHTLIGLFDAFFEDMGRIEDERKTDQTDEGEPPVAVQHEADHKDDGEQIGDDLMMPFREHRVDGLQVIDGPGGGSTTGVLSK